MFAASDRQAFMDLAKKWGRRPYPTSPPRTEVRHGCTCQAFDAETKTHSYDLGPNSSCAYHRYAARHPDDHRSPWNCPTYFDGCNCPDLERMVRSVVASQRRRRGQSTRPQSPRIQRPYNPYV